MSCIDELNVRLEELDNKNIKARKLLYRGFIVKISVDNFEDILISYNTATYNRLLSMIPSGMTFNEVHLKLYQNDQLNHFLQYVTDTYTDVVKRINVSMSTMSREILDIYHMTRKKKNSELYNLLPQSYRQTLYQLHSDYIAQKNNVTNDFDSFDKELEQNENISKSTFDISIGDNIHNENTNVNTDTNTNVNIDVDTNTNDSDDSDNSDNKVSISVDNVYTKLKELDTHMLIELYKDRDVLIKKIEKESEISKVEIKNPIKQCTSTKIQSKLLGSK
jgi:hypothetical protein